VIGLVHGELIKLRTTRTALGFALCGVALVLLTLLLLIAVGGTSDAQDKREAIAVAAPIVFVLCVFGAVGSTGEHRHGTITAALLIAPGRVRATGARLVAYAAAGALAGLVLQLVAVVVGLPLMWSQSGANPSVADGLGLAAGCIAACALLTAFGVAVGALVRSQVGAVVGLLVYFFIAEPLLGLLWHGFDVGGLSAATSALTGADQGAELSPGVAGLVLLGWTVVAGAAAVLADRARDVD
jgi:ABC-2 type transport system permease protein